MSRKPRTIDPGGAIAQNAPPRATAARPRLSEVMRGLGVWVRYDAVLGCHVHARDGGPEQVLTGKLARGLVREIRERLGARVPVEAIFRIGIGKSRPRSGRRARPTVELEKAEAAAPVVVHRAFSTGARLTVEAAAKRPTVARRDLSREIAREFASAGRRGRR